MEKRRFRRPLNARLQGVNPLFHFHSEDADSKELSSGILKQARKSGQLNLSGRGLAKVPEKVWHIDDLEETEIQTLDVRFDRDAEEDRFWEHTPLSSLDLSSNCIAEISSEIKNLLVLTVLNLQNNNLETLPKEIESLQKLTHLNLSHNRLNSLPISFFELRELRWLSLSHNKLEEVSDDIGSLYMLEHLDLSHNSLTALPPGIGFLTRLTQLDASHNKIIDVPPDIISLSVLLKLDLSENNISVLPPLGDLRRMEVLNLQHNQLVNIPNVVGCNALRELHLPENCIQEINEESLESLTRLRVLNLRQNKISTLPDEITALQLLVRLDLADNDLNTLPDALGYLPHLHTLQLEGNPLQNIRRDIVQCGAARLLRFLRQRSEDAGNVSLKLDGNLCSSPTQVNFPDRFMLRSGRSLSLAMHDLKEIPDDVFKEALEAEVTSVDLSKNKLHQVPKGLECLVDLLTDVNLSCNGLVSYPRELCVCKNLQFLDLQKNLLEDLPQELECLIRLKELILSSNRFQEIPKCVYKVPGLEILNVRDNHITAIDVHGLSQLRRLAVLDLANNDINTVPPELGNMTQLRTLELVGNSFRQPRHSILAKGTSSILAYLRDRIPQQK